MVADSCSAPCCCCGGIRYAYFGGGSGWGGTGPGACGLWLTQFPEFTKPLGAPLHDMLASKATWNGAVCEPNKGKQGTCHTHAL